MQCQPARLWLLTSWLSVLAASAAQPLDEWNWRNPSPSRQNFQAITYANGTFVSVGNLGIVFTSTNGIDWIQRGLPGVLHDPGDHTLFGVTYGQDKFVAVGAVNGAFYSSDGESWFQGTPEIAENPIGSLLGVTYANGLFVGVGRYGAIHTSINGVVWGYHPLPAGSADLSAIAYGNGRFTTVALDGQIYTSTNGASWTKAKATAGLPLYGVAYGNDHWVAVGEGGTVLSSTNGLNWSPIPPPTTNLLISVTFAKGNFLAAGGDDRTDYEKGVLLSSTDGVRWQEIQLDMPQFLTGVAVAENLAVAVGYRGSILTSVDLEAWHARSSDLTRIDLFDVSWGHDRFFAVGGFADSREQGRYKYVILDSLNGKEWNQVAQGQDARLWKICSGNGMLVAVGDKAQGNGQVILTSTNGAAWSRQDLDPTFTLTRLTFGRGRFVASGERMLYSTNGTKWVTEINSPTHCNFLGFVGQKFFASNRSGNPLGLRISDDGINWRSAGLLESDTFGPVTGVAWFNGQFIAVSGNSDHGAFFSTNGTAWRKVALNITPRGSTYDDGSSRDDLFYIAYADGHMVCAGVFAVTTRFGHKLVGTIYSSEDGTNWTRRFHLSSSLFANVAFGAATFVAAGSSGAILQSGVLPPTPASIERIQVAGPLTLTIAAPVGRTLRLEYSDSATDPSGWQPLTKVSVVDSPFVFTDSGAVGRTARFYRTVTLP